MLDLLQDVHFPLNLLSSYATPAGLTLPLLDELGRVFSTCTFLFAALDNGKLPAADTKEEKRSLLVISLDVFLI